MKPRLGDDQEDGQVLLGGLGAANLRGSGVVSALSGSGGATTTRREKRAALARPTTQTPIYRPPREPGVPR